MYDYIGYGVVNVRTSGKAEGKFGISEISVGNFKTGPNMNWAKKVELEIRPKSLGGGRPKGGPNPLLECHVLCT